MNDNIGNKIKDEISNDKDLSNDSPVYDIQSTDKNATFTVGKID